jgi:GT2 family glycosyltransferase
MLGEPDAMMRFSIIVPTYARPQRLSECLAGLAALDYPRDSFEVIVVDDGTPGGVESALSPWRARLDLKLFVQENAGPGAARNRGALEAVGECLVFTDDDCVPDAGWLAGFAQALATAPGNMLGGRVINVLDNLYSQASQDVVAYICEYYDGRNGRPRLFTSNNMAVPAEGFRKSGGFDRSFERAAGEDREFCDRWVASGQGSTHVHDALVRHAHSLTWTSFCRQHFQYGRAAVRYRAIRAARRREGLQVEPLSFYTGLLLFPLRADRSWRAWARVALVGWSQAVNAAGFFWEGCTTFLRR